MTGAEMRLWQETYSIRKGKKSSPSTILIFLILLSTLHLICNQRVMLAFVHMDY